MQSTRQVRDPQWVGRRSHRFLAAEHVNRRLWKKLIDVKKIGSAKHVERHRHRLGRFREVILLPGVQFLELSQVELGKRFLEKRGVVLRRGIAGEQRER